MLTDVKSYGSVTCAKTCFPQQKKALRINELKNIAAARLSPIHRSTLCLATDVAEVAIPEESEVFKTNDGVIEYVDDDEAEVRSRQSPVPVNSFTLMLCPTVPQQVDFLGESTSGNLRFVQRVQSEGIVNVLGLEQLDDIINIPYKVLKDSQQVRPVTICSFVIFSTHFRTSRQVQELMRGLNVSPQYPKGMANRAIFCSRTLNLRSIQAIGMAVLTNMQRDRVADCM